MGTNDSSATSQPPYQVNVTGGSPWPEQTTGDGYNATHPWLVRPTDHGPPACGTLSTQYGIVWSIIAVAFVLIGVLLTFFGYRFFKGVMFLIGFIFGSVLVYMIIIEQDVLPPEGNLGIAAGAGILLGLFTMLIQPAGLFVTGFKLGGAVAIVILVAVEQFTHPPTKWIPIGVMIGVGVVGGILALKFQKGMTIAGTSVIGAALGLAGVDYFLELSRMALYIWDRVMAQWSDGLCWYSWFMLGMWPLAALVGMLIQWRFTSVGVDHRLALSSRREQGASLEQARAKQKRETQQTRYRHLYQARRQKGDVISQNFLQSMQGKMSPDMSSLTALNTEPTNEEESTATTTLTQLT